MSTRVKLSAQLRALSSSARINVAPRLSTPISVDKKNTRYYAESQALNQA